MIAVDTSALVAIVFGETDAEKLARVMQRGPVALCAANLFETTMVTEGRQGPDASRAVHDLLGLYDVTIHPVDATLAATAHDAWGRFGKGRHPAGLNFGDCFSYALAKSLAVPLLFKGDDLTQTDVMIAQ